MWGSTSLGRFGAFSELKEQFHSCRTPGCQLSNLADETLLRKNPGTSSVRVDVGQICCVPDDVLMIILIKPWRKKRCMHTSIGQKSCERDHESGIHETNSFTCMLFNDD